MERRRWTRSQARLIIPRTVSEYLECRYARCQSTGLLVGNVEPEGVFATIGLRPQAFSEGLLAGRLQSYLEDGRRDARQAAPEQTKPPPPRTLEQLICGERVEGRIVRVAGRLGLLVDVAAEKLGLLRWRECRGAPRRMLRHGEVLTNLIILDVDASKDRFSLGLRGVSGERVEEESYVAALRHVAAWATVELPKKMLEAAKLMSTSGREGRGRSNGRGRTGATRQARSEADAPRAEAGPRWVVKAQV